MQHPLWLILFGFVFLAMLFLIHSTQQKETINRLIFLNLITGQFVLVITLLGLLIKDFSLIDMSFIYIILGPIASIVFLIHKKYSLRIKDEPSTTFEAQKPEGKTVNKKMRRKKIIKRKPKK